MLAFSPALAPLGAIAVQHHERLDGSGYPRGVSGDAITPMGRILAAADCYHAMTEMRPHRPARSPQEAAAEVRAEVAAGRLDGWTATQWTPCYARRATGSGASANGRRG